MAQLFSDEDVSSRLQGLDWTRDGDEIVRDWKFTDFAESMGFVNRVADAAETANRRLRTGSGRAFRPGWPPRPSR
jgi:pterin-4a-carbinolamine dehydratase